MTTKEAQRRSDAYIAAGIGHMYIMSLAAGEMVDATIKGGKARRGAPLLSTLKR